MTLGLTAALRSHSVVIIDRRDHVGGNCFDYFDENSIDIHAYGTHIFHTDDAEVWRSSLNLPSGIRISMR